MPWSPRLASQSFALAKFYQHVVVMLGKNDFAAKALPPHLFNYLLVQRHLVLCFVCSEEQRAYVAGGDQRQFRPMRMKSRD